ncbi:GLPGLI family protein [Taibaiella koreensis]|uniref:GLPGLI family protein n=1 Tax=Taibaiella koreensis TaxID=1268548 RepID=UPI0013C34444|nr:GLPGLI family protein [Taibaiella koreensis]
MRTICCCLMLLVGTLSVKAQFISTGKIEYERKTSLKLQLQTEEESEWVKSMINKVAQFTVSEFTMSFNRDASEFLFVKEQEAKGMTFSWGPQPGRENKVYTDFKNRIIRSQKQVYENDYLIEEQIPVYQWKIESDMRMIAGYPCRKAVTRICDSVVVVAFYTDQIMVSGGPEGFGGLPGMILGLAVPRLYTTWFATQVSLDTPEVKPFTPVKRSKKATTSEMIAAVQKSTKDWGKYGANLVWWLSL